MTSQESSDRPIIAFLTAEKKKKIHQAALRVLAEVGMVVYHDEGRRMLVDAGASLDADGRVKIPADMVEKALASAPNSIPMFNREGEAAMDLGGYRSYFGTGSDLLNVIDNDTLARRKCGIKDVERAALLCDALPDIDFIMSYAHPQDIPPQRSYLLEFQAMTTNCAKPIVATAESAEDLAQIWQITSILRGSEAEATAKPYFAVYIEPASPLKHPAESIEKLLLCARKGIPAIYSAAPNMGASAPMTIAGQVVQGLAESLFGLVLVQLKNPGAPFIMGMGSAILDMFTSQCSYNAPEYYLSYMTIIEMCHYFDLPSWGYAGTSDSQLPDEQAAFEGGYQTFLATLGGANLNHDVGYLDFGLTGCLAGIVIQEEVIALTKRLKQGVPVDDDTLAVDVIKDVGPSGDFLTHDHTIRHVRSTQWRPRLLNRLGNDEWERQGKKTLLTRARERVQEIFETHTPPALADDKQQAIQAIVDRYKN